ncbi:hypothetical protein FXO37_29536 [Capsicum annuum]|nr:hypothetical protein FXO37_29536 [Capsicum annuum]
MVASITNCLLEWGVDTVFSITVDNASSNDITMIEMSKQLSNWGTNIMEDQHLHVRCMTYILNLIVQDGFKKIDKSVKRVRQAVKYSFYDNGFLDYLCTSPCEDGTKAGAFVSGDWENVRTMVKFLKTFYDLTLKVSASKYVTTNVHFVEIAELDLILKDMIENEDSNLKKMTSNLRKKFRKYWGTPEKMNKMIFISSVLDLCNKLEYVSFAIVDMFEKEIGDKLFDSVESYIKALFEHYVKKSKNSSSSSSSFYSGNSSCISGYGNFQRREIMRTKQQFEKHKEISGGSSNKSELRKYLAEEIEPDSEQFDILCWWKVNEPRFPILVEMARDVLVIPISSVAFECAFSMGGRVTDPFRSSLTPKLVQSLICLQDWLRSESTPINIEEDIESFTSRLMKCSMGNGLCLKRSIQDIDLKNHKWGYYFVCGYKGFYEYAKLKGIDVGAPVGLDAIVDGTVHTAIGSGISSSVTFVCSPTIVIMASIGVNMAKKETTQLTCECERHIETQSGGMAQAISVMAQSGFARAD